MNKLFFVEVLKGRCSKVKKKWGILFFIICAINLAGCQGKSEKEQVLEKEDTQLEQQIMEEKKPVNGAQEETPLIEPIIVKIVNPNTLEIIHTLSPKDLGYKENVETYKKNIEQLVKELARGTEKKSVMISEWCLIVWMRTDT